MNMNAQLRVLKVSAIILFQVLVMSAVSTANGQPRLKQQDRDPNQDRLVRADVQEQGPISLSPADEKSYVGNVYGSVVDAETGKALPGVEFVLTKDPVIRSKKSSKRAIASNDGYVTLPEEINSSNFRMLSDENGEFLINSIPTPYPEKPYTIVATMPGYVSQILNQIPVKPGAVMSLHLTIRLYRGFGRLMVFEKEDEDAPFRYRDDEPIDLTNVKENEDQALTTGDAALAKASQRIFGTREGLVGHTTANGHIIKDRDHFVALPSKLFVAKKGTYDFQVKLTYKGRVVYAPVWDLGPHNKNDNYWDPSAIRSMWRDLPQGLPEAQAAYQNGYNGGKDEYGGKVQNPAGIDLADGTFWDDLKMTNNDWITVEYQWTSGNADYSISSTSAVTWITRGSTASFEITVQSIDGFKLPVDITVSGLPSGASAASKTVNPSLNGWVTTTLSVSTTSTTPLGSFPLTFAAKCGNRTRKASATLVVNPPPGTVTVKATLNGKAWTGSVNYTVTGPNGAVIGSAVSGTTKGLSAGKYTITSISKGPGTLSSVSPSSTQTLAAGGAITFTMNFKR